MKLGILHFAEVNLTMPEQELISHVPGLASLVYSPVDECSWSKCDSIKPGGAVNSTIREIYGVTPTPRKN